MSHRVKLLAGLLLYFSFKVNHRLCRTGIPGDTLVTLSAKATPDKRSQCKSHEIGKHSNSINNRSACCASLLYNKYKNQVEATLNRNSLKKSKHKQQQQLNMSQIYAICIILSIGLLGVYATAMPQQPHVQHLVYYPPPPTPAPILRARRQVLGGSLTSNPSGGADARLDLTKAIGTPEHNVIGQVFAAGNTQTGGPVTKPVTSGASLAYNKYVYQLPMASS